MRRRILLLVVGTTLLVVLAFAIPLAFLARNAVIQHGQDVAVSQARSAGDVLRSVDVTAADIASYLAKQRQDNDHSTTIRLPGGQILGTPQPGVAVPGGGDLGGARPDAPGSRGGPVPSDQQPQLSKVNGGEIATLSVGGTSGPYVVQVFVSNSALEAGLNGWLALLAGASVALLLIGAVGGEIVTRRIVRPLVDTAHTANRITAGDVTARAPVDGPREIAEVGSALNRLADRIDELIADERETVADLSHRLRTPLTALRLDAEALRDPVEAERVGQHVSALERMLTAVIRSARRPQREGRMPAADATAVVGERVLFWSALTDEQGRSSHVELPESPLLVRASAEDLAAAVDALLENVVAHTSEGTRFNVRLAAGERGAVLEVSDDGPGLPADALVRGRSDRGSSGLGMDIVRRCAEASGGSMTIDRSESGGALITLVLGAP